MDDLKAVKYFGTLEDNKAPFDDNLLVFPKSNKDNCNFGMEFK